MDIYTQTTSTSGAQVNYLTVINQGNIPLENYRVFKFIFSLVKGFRDTVYYVRCIAIIYLQIKKILL